MKKLNNSGVIGPVEIGLVLVLILASGFTFWRISSVNNETRNRQSQSESISEQASLNEAERERLEALETIDSDDDGIPVCKTEIEDDGTEEIECESSEMDDDHDNDGIKDSDDDYDDDHDEDEDEHEDEDEDEDHDEDEDEDDSDDDSEDDS